MSPEQLIAGDAGLEPYESSRLTGDPPEQTGCLCVQEASAVFMIV